MARKMKTMDGNNAAAWASYAFYRCSSDIPNHAFVRYGEVTDEWAVDKEKISLVSGQGGRDAVRGRCGWRCARFFGGGRAYDDIHGVRRACF